jgi:hypothetical protein
MTGNTFSSLPETIRRRRKEETRNSYDIKVYRIPSIRKQMQGA